MRGGGRWRMVEARRIILVYIEGPWIFVREERWSVLIAFVVVVEAREARQSTS